MRLIDADDLIEHAWRDKLDSRELIAQMIENAPTVKTEKTPKEIEQQIHEFAEKMYQAGYADGNNTNLIDEAYQEGLNDAWECARKIICDCNYPHNHLRMSVVKGDTLVKFFTETSASEAIQKIKDYEEQQKQADAEVRVGDEVYAFQDSELKRIVIYINDAGDVADTVLPSGFIMSCLIKDLTKTGKHYSQIDEMLKELRGVKDADSN